MNKLTALIEAAKEDANLRNPDALNGYGDTILELCTLLETVIDTPVDPALPPAVGAAPSSEEVREMLARLRSPIQDGACHRDAADLIERLAARAEKYSELLYAVDRKFPNEARHETALRYIRQTEERANSGSSTDAVGVAVPPAPTF